MRPLLNDIALFIEVVNSGNFKRAAERLEMPPSTLSRRIAILEKYIGFKLLNRTTRRVEPTAEGLSYHHRCQSLVEEALLAHEAIVTNKNTITGTLRLTCTSDFANLYLAPYLRTYIDTNPLVSIELILSTRIEDLAANQLDLAIRIGPILDNSLVAHHLGSVQHGIYASPRFLSGRSPIVHPNDLASVSCIRLGGGEAASNWIFSHYVVPNEGQTVNVSVNGRIVAGGPQMAMQLTALGLGVGMLDQRMVQPLLASGQLVQLLTDWQVAGIPVHAVTLSRLMPARVRQFIELLKQELIKVTIPN